MLIGLTRHFWMQAQDKLQLTTQWKYGMCPIQDWPTPDQAQTRKRTDRLKPAHLPLDQTQFPLQQSH